MSQGPSEFQPRIYRVLQIPPIRLNCWSDKHMVLTLVLILATLSIGQDAAAQEAVVSPTVPSNAKTTQSEPTPAETVDDPNAAKKKAEESETVELLTDDLTEHWKVFSSAPAIPESPVWKVVREGAEKELILICSGEPKGFLYTTESCAEFELTLEWKYPKDADGNSGVLVYTQDEPRIWPTSMQVQLHQPKAGDVFPSGDAISDHSSETELNLARPVDTWNEGRIISQSGRLSVEVNGKKAGAVSGAKPSFGSIALQSEGSVVHFRRIRLRRLSVANPEKNADAVPASTTDATCFEPVFPGSPGSVQWSHSDRGSKASVRRDSKVTVTVPRNRRQ